MKNKNNDSVPVLIRMPKELHTQYKQYKLINAPKAALNSVYLAALEQFLSPDEADKKEAAIAKRFDRIERCFKAIEKRDVISAETLALYIRVWLTTSTELPEEHKAAARAQAGRRWKKFLDHLSNNIGGGKTLFADLQVDRIFKPEDFEQIPDENIKDKPSNEQSRSQ